MPIPTCDIASTTPQKALTTDLCLLRGCRRRELCLLLFDVHLSQFVRFLTTFSPSGFTASFNYSDGYIPSISYEKIQKEKEPLV
jgi:hypothetical protein